jgi:gluconolactonase
MRVRQTPVYIANLVVLALALCGGAVRAAQEAPTGPPEATVDLTTPEGVRLVKGAWRYSDTRIIEREHRAPGPDGQPTGRPIKTYDYTPHAGGVNFDDSRWEVLDPTALSQRRATGRLCFNWYRLNVTIPERIGAFDPTGATVVFETIVDDYAEVWVNGELPRDLGQSGGSVIKGWNAPNRLIIGRDVKPGQKIQLAIFGINGPLSDPPANFIWMRAAKLEFHRGGAGPFASAPREVNVEIVRRDPGLDAIVPSNPKIFKLAEGFQFTEGPVWIPGSGKAGGSLLFSDPNANRMYRYSSDGQLSVFQEQSGYSGADIAAYGQPGSNGITLDREGRIVFCQHGNHAIVRIERDGTLTTLADKYEGKRLNSPNDLVCKSDGAIYFTDPPYGLPKFYADPRKELPFSGVYRLKDGQLTLLTKDLGGPNGLAFSPDEKYLYVDNWDERVRLKENPAERLRVVMRYEVQADGTLANGSVFFSMNDALDKEALDGLKVDRQGNLYVSGPGGIWIISPGGRHLGTIQTPMLPANFAWGDEDGKTLYLTARTGLYRMRLNLPGIRP